MTGDGTAGLTGEGDLSINALLDPTLRDNGGPTLTHALLLGSPAINAGTNTGSPPVDQRGFPRSDGSTDIGAYESYESGAAPAPGSVTSQLKLWLKTEAGVTQSGTVSRWDNQVANATLPFVQQATASDRPQYSPSAVNFHPAITFDGVNDDLRDDSVLGSDLFVSDAASIFTVVRTTSNVIIQWLDTLSNRVSLEGGAPRFDFGDLVADRLDGIGTSPGYHIVNAQAAPSTPANLAIYVDGSLNNSKSASSGNPLDPTPTGLLRLGEYPGGGYNAAMDLTEVVIYQFNLSAADRWKVESYLAVKYGLTLNQAAPTSYVASDGTAMWGAALNAGYNNDIAGIGRDDASSLAQTQSRSINIDAIVTLSSASDQNNDEFLLWGNDNGALTETAVGNPAGVLQRLQRIWRVDETGDVGTTTMKLDVNGLPVTGAKKHGEVSRMMFGGYLIDAITNGVHAATWVADPFQALYDHYIPGWGKTTSAFDMP